MQWSCKRNPLGEQGMNMDMKAMHQVLMGQFHPWHSKHPSLICFIFVSLILNFLSSTWHIREDAYSRTGSIFIQDMAWDMAYSLWFNEVWPYALLNHNEYAVSCMKMPPVQEYASSLMRYFLELGIDGGMNMDAMHNFLLGQSPFWHPKHPLWIHFILVCNCHACDWTIALVYLYPHKKAFWSKQWLWCAPTGSRLACERSHVCKCLFHLFFLGGGIVFYTFLTLTLDKLGLI